MENNASLFMDQHQEQSMSVIIPEISLNYNNKEEEDSVENILEEFKAKNNDIEKENKN